MRAPSIASGTIEQATYTWTKQTIAGQQGEGFEVVSPGLRASIPWLQSLDTAPFRIMDVPRHESEAYPEWKAFTAVCSGSRGELSLVYRKIASAGTDAATRTRSLVHLLVGRLEDLDLSVVAEDDPRWLTAEASPPGRPPQLEAFDVAELSPRSGEHTCDVSDEHAAELLERLATSPGGVRVDSRQANPRELSTALLVAIPSALWPALSVAWFVGPDGPVADIDVGSATVAETLPTRAARPAISECALHLEVERVWAALPADQRRWPDFARAWEHRNGGPPAAPTRVLSSPARELGSLGAAGAQPVAAIVAQALGRDTWDPTVPIAESELGSVLASVEQAAKDGLKAPLLTDDDWQGLLSDITSRASARRVARFAETLAIPSAEIEQSWRATGLMALGYALVHRAPDPALSKRWALPTALEPIVLQQLVAALREDRGADLLLARLVGGGMGLTQAARRAILDAFDVAGIPPQVVYEVILVKAELPPPILLSLLREHLDSFSAWLKLPDPYRVALERALRKKRGFNPLAPLLRNDREI